jgi:hypothetical protein
MTGEMCTGTVIGAMRVVVTEAGAMVVVADMAEDMAVMAAEEEDMAAMAVVAAMDGELRDPLSKPDPINL